MIRTLIVDDEPIAVRVLESHLEKIPDVEVVATGTGGVEAIEHIRGGKVDLVFLDIEMPELTGVDLVEAMSDPPEFVFATAHRDYAAEGFELDAVDYLVKPIRFSRVVRAVERYRRRVGRGQAGAGDSESARSPVLNVTVDRQTVRVPISEIRYAESLSDYVKIHTGSESHITRRNISELAEELRPHGIFRIHRSFLASLEHVEAFTNREVEIAGRRLPVSRTYRAQILERLRAEDE